MSHQNVAEIIVETLAEAGAKRCYGVVGDTINHFTDAIRRSDLEWVHVRHEEVGGFAAGGEAYMTRELALCAGTCGPGTLHFVNGLFEAHRSGSPVVLIASQVATKDAGIGFPQDVDPRAIYSQYSVFCESIVNPEQARRMTALAAQSALANNGVAVLVVHGDIFTQTPSQDLPFRAHRIAPSLQFSLGEFAIIVRIERGKPLLHPGRAIGLIDNTVAIGVHPGEARILLGGNLGTVGRRLIARAALSESGGRRRQKRRAAQKNRFLHHTLLQFHPLNGQTLEGVSSQWPE